MPIPRAYDVEHAPWHDDPRGGPDLEPEPDYEREKRILAEARHVTGQDNE